MIIKVTLRKKKISGDRLSLYLDFYPAITNPETGKPTRREFLRLFVFEKVNNPIDKLHNKETLQLAEQIRQKRENLLNKPEVYSDYEKNKLRVKERGEINFVEYYKNLADNRKESNHDNWIASYRYLVSFTKGNIKFCDVNEMFLNDYKNYLLTTKSNKSNKKIAFKNGFVVFILQTGFRHRI